MLEEVESFQLLEFKHQTSQHFKTYLVHFSVLDLYSSLTAFYVPFLVSAHEMTDSDIAALPV